MKRITQWFIILTMVFGGLTLNSCDDQLKNDMMTPGGLVNGSGGGSGGGGGTNPGGGGGGTNPGGGGGGGTNPGGGGGGGTPGVDLDDYLYKTIWYATDNTASVHRSLSFYSEQAIYSEVNLSEDLDFYANVTYSGYNISFKWTSGSSWDADYNYTEVNPNDYSLPKSATISTDLQTITFGGRTYTQHDNS